MPGGSDQPLAYSKSQAGGLLWLLDTEIQLLNLDQSKSHNTLLSKDERECRVEMNQYMKSFGLKSV